MTGDATNAEIIKRISRKEEKYLKDCALGRGLLIESGRELD